MSIISMVLVVVVAFLAGLEGILDQFQFHQPLVACTLIGLVTGNLTAGIMLGGSFNLLHLAGQTLVPQLHPMLPLHLSLLPSSWCIWGDFSTKRNRCRSRCRYSTCSCWSLS